MKITYKIALISPVDFKRDKITVSRLNNELGCDDSPQRFESHLARILASFLTGGESSFGDLYIEGHRVGPAGVLDDELVLAVLLRRDLNRTLRSGRVVLSYFRAGGVVDEKVHVGILQAVRSGLELFPRRERQEVSDLPLVLYLDLLAIERRPLPRSVGLTSCAGHMVATANTTATTPVTNRVIDFIGLSSRVGSDPQHDDAADSMVPNI